MKNNSDIKLYKSYEVLYDIYVNGAYSSIRLNKLNNDEDRAYITRTVYGVLENDVKSEYIISQLADKRPSSKVRLILKLALFLLDSTDTPEYAAVDKCVELCAYIEKYQLKGFVNSFLKRYIKEGVSEPKDFAEKLSVETSTPLWLVKAYIKQYGAQQTEKFLKVPKFTKEHVRPNILKIDLDTLKSRLDKLNIDYTFSEHGGLFVNVEYEIIQMFNKGEITFQSISSIICAEYMDVQDGDKVLDLCAAPGGKTEYLAERNNVKIIACDIHPHRVDLINGYCSRMGVSGVVAKVNDGTQFNKEFESAFDKVLCDVPCSGFGVANKKADIYLNKTYDDVNELSKLQYALLENASKYVKVNGAIVYSTCTMLREENYNIVGKFLKEHNEFELIGKQQLLPDGKGMDGFFMAKLRRLR